MKRKYIFVMGANLSGLGKGIASASIAKLLKDQGYNVCQCKIDGYLNVDAGVLSPLQHGETFVTSDGGEIDLDFGHYERFTDNDLTKDSSITSGKVYSEMLKHEREGKFLGQTVQLTPHYTDYINEKIINLSKKKKADITIVEIGGTVGDAESQLFIEAARQLKNKVGRKNVMYVLLTYIPFLKASKELKTKLTQQAVTLLRGYGISPDMLICRTEKTLSNEIRNKISVMSDINIKNVMEGIDVDSIYKVPLRFKEQEMDKRVCEFLGLQYKEIGLTDWEVLVNRMENAKNSKNIAIVGKYVELHDSYLSVIESIKIAGLHLDTKINIKWIDSEEIENNKDNIRSYFNDVDGVIVPGGFGKRGVEGMILTAQYCRENKLPYLGICLGMQVTAIEFARNVLGYKDATSEEFDLNNNSKNHIIHLMKDQKNVQKGGTMRLGNYKCNLDKSTKTFNIYNKEQIERRHRHRYEFNSEYLNKFVDNKFVSSGINPETGLVEILELIEHPFYIAAQYHPEFNSRFTKPEELFIGLIKSIL